MPIFAFGKAVVMAQVSYSIPFAAFFSSSYWKRLPENSLREGIILVLNLGLDLRYARCLDFKIFPYHFGY